MNSRRIGSVFKVVLLASLPATASAERLVVLPARYDRAAARMIDAKTLDEVVLGAAESVTDHDVIGFSDIEAVLDMERQKDLLGCEAATCFAEIGGALGAERFMTVRVARFSSEFVVSTKLISFADGDLRVDARRTDYLRERPAALLKEIPNFVRTLFAKLARAPAKRRAAPPAPPSEVVTARSEPEPVRSEESVVASADSNPEPSAAPSAGPTQSDVETDELSESLDVSLALPRIENASLFWPILKWTSATLAALSFAAFSATFVINEDAKREFGSTPTIEAASIFARERAEATALAGNTLFYVGIGAAVTFGLTWIFDH